MRHAGIFLKDFLARWTRLMTFSLHNYFPVCLKTHMHRIRIIACKYVIDKRSHTAYIWEVLNPFAGSPRYTYM